jgi:hypothetical protein
MFISRAKPPVRSLTVLVQAGSATVSAKRALLAAPRFSERTFDGGARAPAPFFSHDDSMTAATVPCREELAHAIVVSQELLVGCMVAL